MHDKIIPTPIASVLGVLFLFLLPFSVVRASVTDGTIDTTDRYAWTENVGWIDFGSAQGDIHVTDEGLSGYAWGEQVGWLLLDCESAGSCGTVDFKVSNDGEGNLSGYAWSENLGWVLFDPDHGGVTIDEDGIFNGYAWSESSGWIIFNCETTSSCGTVSHMVKTDWRPQSSRPDCNNGIDDDFDGTIDFPADTGCSSTNDTTEVPDVSEGGNSGGGGGAVVGPRIPNAFEGAYIVINDGDTSTDNSQVGLTLYGGPDAVEMAISSQPSSVGSFEGIASKKAWNLCTGFAVCPPGVYLVYVQYKDIQGNLSPIYSDKISLSGFSFDPEQAQRLVPPDQASVITRNASPQPGRVAGAYIRLRSLQNLIDKETFVPLVGSVFNLSDVVMTPGSVIDLALVFPDGSIPRTTGYVFNQSNVKVGYKPLLALGSSDSLSGEDEDKILLKTFAFDGSEQGNDAMVQGQLRVPEEPGRYDIDLVVQTDQNDPESLATIRINGAVVPNGYVYTEAWHGQARIKNAVITLYWLDPNTKKFDLWPSLDSKQFNPQVTDGTGHYSFFIPEGSYYLTVSAPGYQSYQTPVFFSRGDGRELNIPIKLVSNTWWYTLTQWYVAVGAVTLVLVLGLVIEKMVAKKDIVIGFTKEKLPTS